MRRHLPPLNALKAFEAAGRLGSFAAAASELGVTHGAVSRQIRLLEDWLGRRLFDRFPSQVTLTVDGRSYLLDVGAAFTRLGLATSRYVERAPKAVVRVNAPHTFQSRWLLPRIQEFKRLHPEIELVFHQSVDPVETLPGAFDIAIRRRAMALSGFKSAPFLIESCVPVLSPGLLRANPLADPNDLSGHTLLHSRSVPQLWPDWMALANAAHVRPAEEIWLDGLVLTLQAASDGLGVAIGPSALVAADRSSGRLVAPIGAPSLVLEPFRVLYPADPLSHPAALTFRDWLIDIADRESAGGDNVGRDISAGARPGPVWN